MPNSGCFSGVLRRLLCSGNLPTHPSEALDEPKAETKLVARAAEPGPGVVARLMGLSSLPDANWVPNHRAPGAVSRSKSVNFADYLLHFDSNQAHHRRIRTSASFREVPPLNPQNDFFVLYTKDYAVEIETNLKKPETQRFGEEKQGKEQSKMSNDTKKTDEIEKNELKISKKKIKDEPRREISKNFTESKKCSRSKNSVSVLPSGKYRYKQSVPKNGSAENLKSIQKKSTKQKEAAIGKELNKKTKKKNVSRHVGKKPEPESDPENSSPVSVLDVNFPEERQMERIAEKIRDSDSNGGGGGGRSEGCGEVVERICRLAEEDIREAKWRVKNVDELEELCMEVERHVVNVLLVQTLDEFVYYL